MRETLKNQLSLADLQLEMGDVCGALPTYRQVLEHLEEIACQDDEDVLHAKHKLGVSLFKTGQLDEAESPLKESIAGYRKTLGDTHEKTLKAMESMAYFYMKTKRNLVESEALYQEVLGGYRNLYGEEHPCVRRVTLGLCGVLLETGRQDEAFQIIILLESR